jgi:hypothetical protein
MRPSSKLMAYPTGRDQFRATVDDRVVAVSPEPNTSSRSSTAGREGAHRVAAVTMAMRLGRNAAGTIRIRLTAQDRRPVIERVPPSMLMCGTAQCNWRISTPPARIIKSAS